MVAFEKAKHRGLHVHSCMFVLFSFCFCNASAKGSVADIVLVRDAATGGIVQIKKGRARLAADSAELVAGNY